MAGYFCLFVPPEARNHPGRLYRATRELDIVFHSIELTLVTAKMVSTDAGPSQTRYTGTTNTQTRSRGLASTLLEHHHTTHPTFPSLLGDQEQCACI
jgi:hypothetical protein